MKLHEILNKLSKFTIYFGIVVILLKLFQPEIIQSVKFGGLFNYYFLGSLVNIVFNIFLFVCIHYALKALSHLVAKDEEN